MGSCQCVEVLPNSSPELRLQGLYQGHLQDPQGCPQLHEVWYQHCQWWSSWDYVTAVRLLLGWAVTVTAGLMSYPIDTVRRRMMMTSGGGVKYKGSMDCFVQVCKNEGFMSLMKGAGANVLRGVAGAGVLAGFDKFKALYIEYRTSL